MTKSTPSFSYHERCNYGSTLTALLVLFGFETVAVHLLVAFLWSHFAAIILTVLNLAGMAWLIADYRACKARLHLMQPDGLLLRLGLRYALLLPYSAIRSIEPPTEGPAPRGTLSLKPANTVETALVLVLREPVWAQASLGLRQQTSRIELALDDPQGFEEALRSRLSG